MQNVSRIARAVLLSCAICLVCYFRTELKWDDIRDSPRRESAAPPPGGASRHLRRHRPVLGWNNQWSDPKSVELRDAGGIDYGRAPISVFYNVFAGSEKDVPHVMSIVAEQFSQLRPEHRVFVRSIGVPIATEIAKIDTSSRTPVTFLQHDAEGDEVSTLWHLWRHCQDNPSDRVVYLHSKGSFHPNRENDILRRFLTRGALSEECGNAPDSCSVCSSRMSPVPHPHTPGNMWSARCGYVRKLLDPTSFAARMDRAPLAAAYGRKPSCVGMGRFAAEHWVHSHPDVAPCDLHKSQVYLTGYGVYKSLPKGEQFEMDLQPAPRFDRTAFSTVSVRCRGVGLRLENRLAEYEALYGEEPPDGWWGWKFFGDEDGG